MGASQKSFSRKEDVMPGRLGHNPPILMAVACAGLLASCGDDAAAPIPPRYTIALAIPATAAEGDGLVACVVDIAPAPDTGTTVEVTLASDDAAAAVPTTVTVTDTGTAGFDITVRAINATYEGDIDAIVTATGPDCSPDLAMITVTDDELGVVVVTIPNGLATEGDADLTTCTVDVLPPPTGSDTVEVNIGVNSGYIIVLDPTVTVDSSGPAAFGLSFRADNDVYENDIHATVTGMSASYENGTDTITLTDDELGTVDVWVTASATEGDASVSCTVTVTPAPDSGSVAVTLSSGSSSDAAPAVGSVDVDASGTASFDLDIRTDNATSEGDVNVTIRGQSTDYEGGEDTIWVQDD